jgi:hypothetical protein
MMARVICILAALVVAASPALGARDFRKSETAPGAKAAKTAAPQDVKAKGANPEVLINAQTAVYLDGQPCPYSAIPASAVITYAEVAEDGKTLLLIRFRSGR